MNGNPRTNFVNWVRAEFPELDKFNERKEQYEGLVERLDEVHEAAIVVLEETIKKANQKVRDYYLDYLDRLKTNYKAGDYVEYAKALEIFIESIEQEAQSGISHS
jgi:hypothetical protein